MSDSSDDIFGKIAVQLGYISQPQLKECLESLDLVKEGGGSLSLEKILIKKGYITNFQAGQIVKHVDEPAAPIPLIEEGETSAGKASDSAVTSTFLTSPSQAKPYEEEILIDSISDLNLTRHDLLREAPHTTIGKCTIIRKIGGGAVGDVYLAMHQVLKKKVVVKVLADHLMLNTEYVDRLKKEAILTSKLEHPNIVQVYDADTDKGKFLMVMQYVDGENLQKLIENGGAIDYREAVKIIIEICKGLGYAHKRGIIHRDIKPENILISQENELKITDFHLAIDAGIQTSSTTRGILLGTPYFVPPELAQGGKADQRSDIYSLGVMFYYMITGKRPFTGKTSIDILMKHIKEKALSPRLVNGAIPDSLCKIAARMMAKNPDQRYSDVNALTIDLEKFLRLEGQASPTVKPPPAPRATQEVIPMLEPIPQPAPLRTSSPETKRPSAIQHRQRVEQKKEHHSTLVGVFIVLFVIAAGFIAYLLFIAGPNRAKSPEPASSEKSPPTRESQASKPVVHPHPQPPPPTPMPPPPQVVQPTPVEPAEADWMKAIELERGEQSAGLLRDTFLAYVNQYPESPHLKEARERIALYRTRAGEESAIKTPPKPQPLPAPDPSPAPKPETPPIPAADIAIIREAIQKKVSSVGELMKSKKFAELASLFETDQKKRALRYEALFKSVAVDVKEWKVDDVRIGSDKTAVISVSVDYLHTALGALICSENGKSTFALSKAQDDWVISSIDGDKFPSFLNDTESLMGKAEKLEHDSAVKEFNERLSAIQKGEVATVAAQTFAAFAQKVTLPKTLVEVRRYQQVFDAYSKVAEALRTGASTEISPTKKVDLTDKKFAEIFKRENVTETMAAHACFVAGNYPPLFKLAPSIPEEDRPFFLALYYEGLGLYIEALKAQQDQATLVAFAKELLAKPPESLPADITQTLQACVDDAAAAAVKEDFEKIAKQAEKNPSSGIKSLKDFMKKHPDTSFAREAAKMIPLLLTKGKWVSDTTLTSWKTTSANSKAEVSGNDVKLIDVNNAPNDTTFAFLSSKSMGPCNGIRVKLTIDEIANNQIFLFAYAWNKEQSGLSFFGIQSDHLEVADLTYSRPSRTKAMSPRMTLKTKTAVTLTLVWDEGTVYGFLNDEFAFSFAMANEQAVKDYLFPANKDIGFILSQGTVTIHEVAYKK